MPRAILSFDMDAFFCQVEAQAHPELKGQPLAVQQHCDIIAVSYAARALGVRKHMAPDVIRDRFPSVRVVHTLVLDGGKVSYAMYRHASARAHACLRAAAPRTAVVARGRHGLDEFLVDVTAEAVRRAAAGKGESLPSGCRVLGAPEGHPSSLTPSPEHPGGAASAEAEELDILRAAAHVGESLRARLLAETGLVATCAAAGNALLAKFGCVLAKPDGLALLPFCFADAALGPETLGLDRVPGCRGGDGSVAAVLGRERGVSTVAGARALSLDDLRRSLGEARGRATYKLVRWIDEEEVRPRGPPTVVASQMALTPFVLPDRPDSSDAAAAAGSSFRGFAAPRTSRAAGPVGPAPSWLLPLAPWDWPTARRFVRVLALDLASRLRAGAAEDGRWPTKLVVGITVMEPVPRTRAHRWPGGGTSPAPLPEGEVLPAVGPGPSWRRGGLPDGAGGVALAVRCCGAELRWTGRGGTDAPAAAQAPAEPHGGPVLRLVRPEPAAPDRAAEPEAARGTQHSGSLSAPRHRERGPLVSTAPFPRAADPGAAEEDVARLLTAAARPAFHAAARKGCAALGWEWDGDLLGNPEGCPADDAPSGAIADWSASRLVGMRAQAALAGVRESTYTLPVAVVSVKLAASGFRSLESGIDRHFAPRGRQGRAESPVEEAARAGAAQDGAEAAGTGETGEEQEGGVRPKRRRDARGGHESTPAEEPGPRPCGPTDRTDEATEAPGRAALGHDARQDAGPGSAVIEQPVQPQAGSNAITGEPGAKRPRRDGGDAARNAAAGRAQRARAQAAAAEACAERLRGALASSGADWWRQDGDRLALLPPMSARSQRARELTAERARGDGRHGSSTAAALAVLADDTSCEALLACLPPSIERWV